jgi:nucleotide-binding universal stress UspA family protein
MQRQILVPLDGSHHAEGALSHAALLARATSSSLTLLRIVAPATYAQGWPEPAPLRPRARWEMEERERAGSYLTVLARQMEDQGLAVRTEVRQSDDVAGALAVRANEDPGVYAVAIATHGWSGPQRWALGSVTERLLHTAVVPLLVVPADSQAPPQEATCRRILVPLDGSAPAARALEHALELAFALAATLLLVAVVPTAEQLAPAAHQEMSATLLEVCAAASEQAAIYLGNAAQELRNQGRQVWTRVASGRPADEILRASQEEQADLIVMALSAFRGTPDLPGRGATARWTEIVLGAGLPVLLIP